MAVARGANITPAAAAAPAWSNLSFTAGEPFGPPMVTVRSMAISNKFEKFWFTVATIATQ